MRKCLLGFAVIAVTFQLVGCGGGDDVSSAPQTDKQPNAEQQKEIDAMKANMSKVSKKTH